ncbi:MAG: type II toxin-antitoxin system RelE/ParE family toxin [Desulfuromonadaceae bacterium]|nr:type II toxin-antitoxin system RelE/ParE family toxin [Desulfuromonadaceae bacterium]
MNFAVIFHPSVKDDASDIAKAIRERIRNAIDTRLTSEPTLYGKPLRGTLAGYWKLRVGDWRVVYAIRGAEVIVFAIKHCSRVYDEIGDRL